MRKTFDRILKSGISLAATLALLGGGCQTKTGEDNGRPAEQFSGADEVSHVTRIGDEQIAAGARTDATLRPYHFDRARLNSLGREKLDLLSREDDRSDDEMVVYLDLPVAESDADKRLADARHDAVADYLMSRGLSEDSFRLESGYNAANTVSAASLKDTGSASSASAGAASSGAASASTTSKTSSAGTTK